jgi:stage II sporulation protein P
MKRRHGHRRKKRIYLLLFCFFALICSLSVWNVSADPSKKSMTDTTLQNVRSEGYVQLQQPVWNPLQTESNKMVTEKAAAAVAATTTSSPQETTETDAENPAPYPTEWNVNENYSVIRTTYSDYDGTAFFTLPDGGMVKNKSDLSNTDLQAESQLPPAFRIAVNEEPQVLIMHTHTTETYEPFVRENYDPQFNYRTTDNSKNVVAVGDAIVEELEAVGIGVIHSDTVHDYPSYNGAYERSAETVQAILEEYPSIKVVLDIHRDAICTDTTLSQPIVTIDGKEAAQVMIISGCDDGTMDLPNYLLNFRFACRLQSCMETKYPGLTRPILFDYRKYNQDLTTGSLLIEVGSHGNTIAQAVYSGHLIGSALAEVLLALR